MAQHKFTSMMRLLSILSLLVVLWLPFSEAQSIRRLRNVYKVEHDVGDDATKATEEGDFSSEALVGDVFRYLESSMSMPLDECVGNFEKLRSVVESTKGDTTSKSITLCAGTIKFGSVIDMTDTSFEMKCEISGGSCTLDGQGSNLLFKAGELGGAFFGQLSDHVTLFENIVFRNGNHDSQGGAFLIVGGETTMKGCSFRENVASDGGALYLERGKAVIESCVFQDNISQDVGGAMKVEQCAPDDSTGILDLTIRNTKFQNNTALGGGDNGKDIYNDCYPDGSVDCGAGSGNQFCDAEPGMPTAIGVFGSLVEELCPGSDIVC